MFAIADFGLSQPLTKLFHAPPARIGGMDENPYKSPETLGAKVESSVLETTVRALACVFMTVCGFLALLVAALSFLMGFAYGETSPLLYGTALSGLALALFFAVTRVSL
jgi:hypothetical protein